MRILGAEFLTSAAAQEGWPADDRPEIAFVGRSNVGKSSMLNRLVGQRGLARVSKTPGRTRLLNFFDVTVELAKDRRTVVRICDLPGYGFAKVSKAERAQWVEMIESYLEGREALRAVVVIIDVRVGPTADDVEMVHWLEAKGRRAIVVATKLDKLPKARRAGRLRQIEPMLQLPPRGLMGFSAEEGLGKDELWHELLRACE